MRILLFITKHIEGVLPRIQTTTINDSLRFRFAAHARFVNASALTRLWLEQAPAFTGNVHLISKSSLMSYYSGWLYPGQNFFCMFIRNNNICAKLN